MLLLNKDTFILNLCSSTTYGEVSVVQIEKKSYYDSWSNRSAADLATCKNEDQLEKKFTL